MDCGMGRGPPQSLSLSLSPSRSHHHDGLLPLSPAAQRAGLASTRTVRLWSPPVCVARRRCTWPTCDLALAEFVARLTFNRRLMRHGSCSWSVVLCGVFVRDLPVWPGQNTRAEGQAMAQHGGAPTRERGPQHTHPHRRARERARARERERERKRDRWRRPS